MSCVIGIYMTSAVPVLYLLMCVIAVCASRIRNLKQQCPKFRNCYEREQLLTLLMVSMADDNLSSLAVSAFCLFQHPP